MYQFTTTSVINSATDSSGVAKYAGALTYFDVKRVNKFLKANIVSINKRPYQAGVKEIAQITVPTLTANKVARLTVDLRLSQSTNSEYASTYLYFKKPIDVEIIASATAATDAAAFVTQLNTLKDRFGYTYITASASGATITLTAKDNNQRFHSVIVSEQTANTESITMWDYVTKATGSVTTAGKLGFGDDEWMIKAIQIPTMENTRFFGINKEERPVLGGNYSEYVIRYNVTKDHEDGIVVGANSITTHVFYVLSSLVSGFETELAKLSTIPYTIDVTVNDASLANSATAQMSATNAVGPVVWSVTSGTSATVNASTGVVTAHASTDGDTVVRGTDSVGNYGEVTITVA